jgi:predicted amidohydrolase YtcJ
MNASDSNVLNRSDTVFVGGRVITMGAAGVQSALAVRDGLVLAVGPDREVVARAGPAARVVDLDKRAVVPGFVDAHLHLTHLAMTRLGVDCRTPMGTPARELVERMRAAAGRAPRGVWLRGWGYDEGSLEGGRPPTRAELDRALPDHPVVVVHANLHQCLVNTAALRLGGTSSRGQDPPGGVIERDRRGRATGRLFETAGEAVDVRARASAVRDGAAVVGALRATGELLLAAGITRVCDAALAPHPERVLRALVDDPAWHVQLHGLGVDDDGMFCPPDGRLARCRDGDRTLVEGVKLFCDGGGHAAVSLRWRDALPVAACALGRGLQCRRLPATAQLRTSRVRASRHGVRAGTLFYRPGELSPRLERAVALGLTVAVHAIGNAAIDQALDGCEQVRRRDGDRVRLRIEHAMLVGDGAVRRFAELGVAAVVQPRFAHDFGDQLLATGIDRALRVLPLRELVDAGVVVAGSSDAPVTEPDVLAAMQAAVIRRAASGERLAPEQGITALDALALYTRGAAVVLGVDDVCGALAPGKRADFVVLSRDPTSAPPEAIGSIAVEQTWVGGRQVYAAPDARPLSSASEPSVAGRREPR